MKSKVGATDYIIENLKSVIPAFVAEINRGAACTLSCVVLHPPLIQAAED